MCVYYKKIIYLSCMEHGIKVKRAGFIKMEFRREACSLDMHVSGMDEVKEGKYNIEALTFNGQKHLIGSILLYRGKGDCRIDFTDGTLEESKGSCKEIDKISISLSDARWIEGSTGLKADPGGIEIIEKKRQNEGRIRQWITDVEAAEINEGIKGWRFQENFLIKEEAEERQFQEDLLIKEEAEERQFQNDLLIKEEAEERRFQEDLLIKEEAEERRFQKDLLIKEEAEERQFREDLSTKEAIEDRWIQKNVRRTDFPEETLPQKSHSIDDFTGERSFQESYIASSLPEASPSRKSVKKEVTKAVREQLPAKEIRMDEVILDDKWAQLCRIYQIVHPYEDEREYISIQPRDFVIMTSDYQHLVNNSFLLHGFYNYRHLILGKEEGEEVQKADEEGEKKKQTCFYLGVPGVYYEREKMVARMFGFEAFECKGGRAETGKFGYYLRKVKI
ncbi:MAG: hypothetical protein IKM28_07435 [Lachnospiraceae bacterium]|nr:hypothetical protein [Lachnospiraceae bacterium]